MGYESKIYIVEKTNYSWNESDNKKFARVLAVFDMACFRDLSDWFRNKPATEHYIYADNSDTQIVEDCYGDTLKEASVKDVIEKLEKIIKSGENYRRIFPLLATLKTFDAQGDCWGNIAVLHYGH